MVRNEKDNEKIPVEDGLRTNYFYFLVSLGKKLPNIHSLSINWTKRLGDKSIFLSQNNQVFERDLQEEPFVALYFV